MIVITVWDIDVGHIKVYSTVGADKKCFCSLHLRERERVGREMRRSVRMDDKYSHIHTSPLAFALTVSLLLFIALPYSHSQPPPPLCAQQLYRCNWNVSAIFDPPWEKIPPSQCNGPNKSLLLTCHAHYESQNFTVKDIDNTTHTMKLMPRPPVDHVCTFIGAIGIFICLIIGCRKCMSSRRTANEQDIEVFLRDHGTLAQKKYKFSEVKKMTKNFTIKLGEGGFGVVYKGELRNGYHVAVKILTTSKGNGKDFINEVASISRTSHVNVVQLLGFCLEGKKKALIYEFMPNGSLDKFIGNKGLESTSSLSWDNLLQIAKGIARGLEYLHKGCNTRILHFDIKPHNILLDENFCPKISDFGLAKLCPGKESTISVSDARGTIGYVAPEVCNKHFGGVSQKSDVYSYGMMLLDIVGVRNNVNEETTETSEYFPDWIYRKLEQDQDLRSDIVTEEKETERRMITVSLWCIQTFPKDRPTMSRVIEMLEGNMNSQEIPPKPVLSYPSAGLVPEWTTTSLQSE
ncbi:hypothetical protein LR48_Vigan232s000500 [Vigna angularis]|uniref:Protein kinase domain-containing protein n=1 Tax=Phaseolus angularis TaxID=3914 RepID=A0A0L9T6B3_PHAAN|nr:hypothetical protein LR48_Vigan232s000500 [Vigna angularis]